MSPVRTAPADLSAADATLRHQYLDEVLGLLYPAGAGTAGTREFLVIPHARRPRLLVPAGAGRLAAGAVRRYAEPQSRLARFKRDAVVAALRTGVSRLLLRDRVGVPAGPGSVEAYLGRLLGREVSVSIHIGPARANRKPVLQVLDADGATVCFAKLGPQPLTRRLVQAEAAALATLAHAGLQKVTVPRLIHADSWRGTEIMLQSPLPIWQPRVPLAPARLAAAMREVATVDGLKIVPLCASGYWTSLRALLTELDASPEGRMLSAAADQLAIAAGNRTLHFGAWHGDWAPWNMAALADTILLWDWERFATGVPLGFDAVHFALQADLQAGHFGPDGAGAAVESVLARASELLEPVGVGDPSAGRLTTLLYLIDLAARYLADRQAEAGARLGVLGTWLLPVLVRHVTEGSL